MSAGADRRIVLVSGPPGAGKSTLAGPLAAALALPLFSKDLIKERIHEALVTEDDASLETSRRIGAAAMEVMWMLAAHAPAAVLEANFRPHSAYERGRIEGLGARLVEVHCRCPDDEILRRYAERGRTAGRHRTHVLAEITREHLAEFDRPMGLGPVIAVDTSTPVDVAALAADVRAAFAPGT